MSVAHFADGLRHLALASSGGPRACGDATSDFGGRGGRRLYAILRRQGERLTLERRGYFNGAVEGGAGDVGVRSPYAEVDMSTPEVRPRARTRARLGMDVVALLSFDPISPDDGGHFLVTLDQASVVVRLQCMSPESLCNLRSQTERLAPAASARSTDPDSSPRSLMAAITPTKGGLGLNTT
ncbi:unnamed protein product [Cutaneotrichosporon oleaginosum]